MKWYWYPWIIAVALGGLNAVYDAWPRSESSRQAKFHRECVQRFTGAGYDRGKTKQVCRCMMDRAQEWHDANPDGDYTREIHRKLSMTCVNRIGLTKAAPKTRWQPVPPPDPATWQRVYPGQPYPRATEQSDWGGQGFAQEENPLVEE